MLAARHRARLAMQDSNEDTQEASLTRILRTQNVRRRLFVDEADTDGPEDNRGFDDNQTNEFVEEARGNLEKAKERWNFDFVNETPLPGNYEWVKLDKDGNQVRNSVWEANMEGTENDTEESKKTSESGLTEANCNKAQEPSPSD